MKRTLLLAALLAAGVAQAQPAPHGPPGPPPGPPGAPSPEALASVPDLDASKQIEVRKLLIQRGDAHDALRAKEDAEREAMKSRYRAEHERIDDDSSARLRKLLGDDGYRALAAWLVGPRGGMGPGPDRPRGDGRPPGPATGPNDQAHPVPPGPATGFNDPPHPVAPGPATGFNDPAPPVPPEPDHDGADPEARVR